MEFYVHKSSYIDNNVKIGDDTKIWYFCHVSENAVIGNNCNIGQNVYIDKDVSIGNFVKIQNNVSVYKGVEIRDKVFLGPSCVFTNVINPRSFINRKSEFKKTIVDEGATIGANSTIICGVSIGKYAMVGAGSVVTRNVSDFALVKGSPARFYGYVCECGKKLVQRDDYYFCDICNKIYNLPLRKIEEGV